MAGHGGCRRGWLWGVVLVVTVEEMGVVVQSTGLVGNGSGSIGPTVCGEGEA